LLIAPPTVPLSLGGASLASLREILIKEYLNIRGYPSPPARLSAPLIPFSVNCYSSVFLKEIALKYLTKGKYLNIYCVIFSYETNSKL